MARYEFYEILSARNDEAETAADGGVLHRRSFGCAERSDLHLFVWTGDDDKLQEFQLLFQEHFVSWSCQRGLAVGVTSRHEFNPFADRRGQGVRTLHATDTTQTASILDAARQLLAQSDLPLDIDGAMRAALGRSTSPDR
ncbi:MAG: hypothetical protein JJU22_14885 [Gammaproteobacteria bacterium]|nr:hypothetical protein [Gammaproteobacteria bacterium]